MEIIEGISDINMGERYPTYRALKESAERRPTGAKVVLIHPSSSIEGAKQKKLYGDLTDAGSMHPPQGLCSLAAILRENGYRPIIIDAEPLGIGADETARMAMEHDPAYVGITSYTFTFKVVQRIASKIKEIQRDRKRHTSIILGGSHMTFLPKKVMETYADLDFGVFGEGEITLVELIDALECGESIKNIPNLIYRDGDNVIKNDKRGMLHDMDELPLPAWDLLPRLDKYYHPAGDNIIRLPSIAIITSRGCPGKCIFCNPRGLGTKFRRHSAGYVIKMLEYLQKTFGIKDVFIVDDMFLFDRENVLTFCKLLKESALDMTWSVFGRVDYVDRELLATMKAAGCWQIGYGLESGSNKILGILKKGQTISKMERAIKDADDVGIIVRGMFMVGNFGETRETLMETIAFVKRNPIKDFHVNFFTPMPGTPSFQIWKKYGEWEVENTGEGSTSSQHSATFVPFGMTKEELIHYQKLLYSAFIKPSTLLYHAKKLFRPNLTLFILKGGFSFIRYAVLKRLAVANAG